MALGAELATAFVRIRPLLSGFAGEASSGVKAGLSDMQAEVAATTRANVSSTMQAVDANTALKVSYTSVAETASRSLAEAGASVAASAEAVTASSAKIEADLAAIAAAGAKSGMGLGAGIAGGVRKGERESEGALTRLKGRLLNLGTLIGVGFGAEITLRFVKDITSGAASVQKSVEVIKSAFGPDAAKVIVAFGDKAASALGISALVANQTSARFGILFKNLGIGQGAAAQMTVNLEKLAGSLSAIRGIDPARALQQITLAMLGNVRSLKQLGLSIDPATEKLQAWKMGLIASVSDALTPATRAQAIYALAVQHLPAFLALAKKHSGDLANQQRRLSAEWSNAKDQIGTALLPVFTRYTTHLANWLSKMIRTGEIQRDVNAAMRTASAIISAVRAALGPLVSTIGGLVGVLGGARNAVKLFLAAWAVSKLLGVATTIGGSIVLALTTLKTNIVAAKGESTGLWASMKAGAIGTAVTIKGALLSTGIGALIIAISFVTVYVLTHWKQVKAFTLDLAHSISAIWAGLKDILIGYAKMIGGEMTTAFTLPFRALLEGASKVTGFLDKLHIHIGGQVKEALNGLKTVTTGLFTGGAEQAAKGAKAIGAAVGTAWHKSIKDTTSSTTADPAAKTALYNVGKDLGTSLGQGLADVLAERKAAISAAQNKLADAVAAANASVSSARRQVARTIHDTNAQIAALITTGNQNVEKAAEGAAKNLNTLGGKVATAISKFFDKGGGRANLKNTPLGQQLAALREQIAGGKGGAGVINAAQELAAQLQSKQVDQSKLKEKVGRHLADLSDELNKGEITVKQFHNRLLTYLRSLGVSYAAVGKTLGKAQADAYQAAVAATLKQAGIIAEEPKKLREHVQRTGAGFGLKVIDVQDVRAREDRKIAGARAKAQERVAAARHHETMTEMSAAKKVATASLTEQKTIAKYAGKIAAHTAPKHPKKKSTDHNRGRVARGARTAALNHH